MAIETTNGTLERVEDLYEAEGVLARIETVSTEGWMLHGRPVESWARDAVTEADIAHKLAGDLAISEGLSDTTPEWAARASAIYLAARAEIEAPSTK